MSSRGCPSCRFNISRCGGLGVESRTQVREMVTLHCGLTSDQRIIPWIATLVRNPGQNSGTDSIAGNKLIYPLDSQSYPSQENTYFGGVLLDWLENLLVASR